MSKRKSIQSFNRRNQRRQERRANAVGGFAPAATGKILAAYVPIPAIWQTTGFGTVAIAREESTGSLRFAFAVLDLQRGGLYIPGVKKDLQAHQGLTELEDLLKNEKIPASIPGDPDLAGKLLFGAHALSLERGNIWPEAIEDVLNLFPRPTGCAGDWLCWLKSSDGGIGEALWRLVEHQPDLWGESPEDKDPVVITSITCGVPDTGRLLKLLIEGDPEFICDGEDGDVWHFTATRPYPKGHWNPLSQMMGARQMIGHVSVRQQSLTIEAKALSLAARVFTRLIQLYGPGIQAQRTQYDDMNRALRARKSNA